VSALDRPFGVESVRELRTVPPDVAPPYLGRPLALDDVRVTVPFRVRMISSLAPPGAAYRRDDMAGGMVTLPYDDVRPERRPSSA
jgi:hypothetical protein